MSVVFWCPLAKGKKRHLTGMTDAQVMDGKKSIGYFSRILDYCRKHAVNVTYDTLIIFPDEHHFCVFQSVN